VCHVADNTTKPQFYSNVRMAARVSSWRRLRPRSGDCDCGREQEREQTRFMPLLRVGSGPRPLILQPAVDFGVRQHASIYARLLSVSRLKSRKDPRDRMAPDLMSGALGLRYEVFVDETRGVPRQLEVA